MFDDFGGLDWETSDLYLRLHHHDERRDDDLGYCHEVRIATIGTMLDLHDEDAGTPRETGNGRVVPERTRLMSGLTQTLMPVAGFDEWWSWFVGEKSRPVKLIVEVDEDTAREWLPEVIDEADKVVFDD